MVLVPITPRTARGIVTNFPLFFDRPRHMYSELTSKAYDMSSSVIETKRPTRSHGHPPRTSANRDIFAILAKTDRADVFWSHRISESNVCARGGGRPTGVEKSSCREVHSCFGSQYRLRLLIFSRTKLFDNPLISLLRCASGGVGSEVFSGYPSSRPSKGG